MSEQPHFQLQILDGIAVVTFAGAKVAPEARDGLHGLVEDDGYRRLLLNFENVRFLSSNALGILVGLNKKVDAAGGRLTLCCLDPDLLKLFHMTKLDSILEIHDRQEDALRAF